MPKTKKEEIAEKWEAADAVLQAKDQTKAKQNEKDNETPGEMQNMAVETLGAMIEWKAESRPPIWKKVLKREKEWQWHCAALVDYSKMEFQLKREELKPKKD